MHSLHRRVGDGEDAKGAERIRVGADELNDALMIEQSLLNDNVLPTQLCHEDILVDDLLMVYRVDELTVSPREGAHAATKRAAVWLDEQIDAVRQSL